MFWFFLFVFHQLLVLHDQRVRHLRAAMSQSSSLSTPHACSRLSWTQRGGTLSIFWKETKPKVILPSSSSGAGVWCLLIFQFDEHDKFIKIAFAVNHSGREEVLTTKPKGIFLILRLLWPVNDMGRSTECIHNKLKDLLFTLEWVISVSVNFFFLFWVRLSCVKTCAINKLYFQC